MTKERADYFGLRPITLWRCNTCGYVDVVRPEADRACGGCEKETSGTTHRYRPDPIGVRTDRDRLSVAPTSPSQRGTTP